MTQRTDNSSCQITCWIVSALVGVAVAAMLMLLAEWSFIQAVFMGFLACVILGVVLGLFICNDSTAKADLEKVKSGQAGAAVVGAGAAAAVAATAGSAPTATSSAGNADAAGSSGAGAGSDATASSNAGTGPAGSSAAAAASAAGATTASKAFEMQPSAPLAGQAELAARKGDWKYEGEAKKPAAKKPAAKKPAAKKAAPKKAAAKASGDAAASTKASGAKSTKAKAAAPKAAASKAKAAPAKAKRAPVAADGQPELLKGARAGGADDLKLISGVGPKLEGTLNELGFYHFDQIAGWRKKEIEWVDSRLKFKGRIERDDWMSQAKILAKGGETEFSKRAKK